MTKFFMTREEIIDEHNSNTTFIASYETKKKAFAALYSLAKVLGSTVDFEDDGLSCDDPAIWSWSVTDLCGAMYKITEEVVDENGNIADPFGF